MTRLLLLLSLLVGCDLVIPLSAGHPTVDAPRIDQRSAPDLAPDSGESCVTTLAGGLDAPLGLALDRDGSVLVAESGGHRILRISADGTIGPVAGSGVPGCLDALPATDGQLDSPSDVALGTAGVVYIADTGNHVIRKLENGALHTHAGSNIPGFGNGSIYTAMFHSPTGIIVDGWGVLYVADTDNNRIRRVSGDTVSSLDPSLALPRTVAVDGVGTVFAVQDHRVVSLPGSPLATVAGGTEAGFVDGAAGEARFRNPRGIVVLDGMIYLADRDNHRIRRIAAGQVTTLAGTGSPGATDGQLAGASFNEPTGLALDPWARRLYIADTGNGRVRVIGCGLK